MRNRRFAILVVGWTVLVVGPYVAAQSPTDASPNYQLSYPIYQYGFKATSIADVDFRNLTVFWHGEDKSERRARLRDGTFEQKYADGGGEKVIIDLVQSFTPPGEAQPRAVIDILWTSCGGSCSSHGLAQVFELRSGHPTVIEQIIYERHAPDTGAKFEMQSGLLILTGRSAEPSPNCCPKSLDVMAFEWGRKEFVFKNSKRVSLADTP